MPIKTGPAAPGSADHHPGCCSLKRGGSFPDQGFQQHQAPAGFPALRCSLSRSLLLSHSLLSHSPALLALLLPSASASVSQHQRPGVRTAMAPPGVLRVTAQPGSSRKSVTRTLAWSPGPERNHSDPLHPWTVQPESRGHRGSCHRARGDRAWGLRRTSERPEKGRVPGTQGASYPSGLWSAALALHGTCLALDKPLPAARPGSPRKIVPEAQLR